MKRFLLLSLVLFISCGQVEEYLPHSETPRDKAKKEFARWGALEAVLNFGALDYSVPCIPAPNGPADNPLYFYQNYFQTFNAIFAQTPNIILGNSTEDIAIRYPGYYDPAKTTPYPVSGNTLCDMTRQWNAIHQVNPTAIVIGSAGGNDMLRALPNADIITNGITLINKSRARWPGARIVMISLHPTLVAYANANKATTNAGIKNYLNSLINTCWVDTLPIWGIAEGAASSPSDLIDTIHPSQTKSFQIRAAVTACGVVL